MLTAYSPNATLPPGYRDYNEGPKTMGVCLAMAPLAAIIIALRFWARKQKSNLLGWEDWLSLAALPVLWSVAIIAAMAVRFGGVGKHLAVNMEEDPNIFARSLLCLFICEITYGTVISLIKASILVMCLRIFPTRFIQISTWVVGALVLSWWLAMVFATTFQCDPVVKTWHPYMKAGDCLDKNQFFLGTTIPNITIDVLILVLPMYEVSKLSVRLSQKIAISCIFLLGLFVILISCFRLKARFGLLHDGLEGDFTAFIGPYWIWSAVGPTIGLLCASLPAMQPLMQLLSGPFIASADSSTKSDSSHIVALGGNCSKGTNRSNEATQDGHFRRLDDNDSAEHPVLWPQNWAYERDVIIEAKQGDDVPLESIRVRRDITWAESSISK